MQIERLRQYVREDKIFVTAHAAQRFRERGLSILDVCDAVLTGEIIERYEDDFPFPSCLVLGFSKGKALHTVLSDSGSESRVITAYCPNLMEWSEDFRRRI